MQFLISIFALIFISGCNQEKTSGLLWKISEGTNVIYLQGVMHAGPERYVAPSTKTLSIFNAAQHVVVESINENPSQEYRQKSGELSEANRVSLRTLLDKLFFDRFLTAQEYTDALAFDVTHYDHAFTPAFSKKINRDKSLSSLFGDFKLGLDSTLAKSAISKGKHVSALEQNYNQRLTWHKTCKVNELFPSIIRSYEQLIYEDRSLLTMRDIYIEVASGNLEKARISISNLERILPHYKVNGDCSYHPRTKQWAENWESVMKRAPNGLVLVGAYHVVQEPTLLTLLREKGYVVERIP